MLQQYFSTGLTSFNPTECSAVIAACGEHKQLWSQSLQALNLMQEQILIPDVVAYTTCLVACTRSKESQRALLLFEDIPKFAVRPSEVTFGAAIQACATCAMWQRGLELLGAVPQNSFAATSAIRACGQAGRWRLAIAILEDLVRGLLFSVLGPSRPLGLSGSLLGLHGHGLALKDVGELKGSGRVVVNACITACAKSSEWAPALSLLVSMASRLTLPDVVSYSAAISACEKAGIWTAALALYASMMSSRTKIEARIAARCPTACNSDSGEARDRRREPHSPSLTEVAERLKERERESDRGSSCWKGSPMLRMSWDSEP